MAKNIKDVKKLIYDTMKNDATLTALLADGSNGIWQSFPQEKEIKHPAIFFNIISDEAFPYEEDNVDSKFSELVFGLEVVDDGPNSLNCDNIESRLFELFNGKFLKNTSVRFKEACKRSYFFQYYDSEIRVWRTVSRYTTVVSPV